MTIAFAPSVSLRQLQYLVAVADTRSFRHAAEACHVAQPSLSAQVALAEKLLGLQVFERDRRGVRVTPAGEAVVQQARQVLVAASDLRDLAQQYSDPFRGTLRLGVIPTVGPYLLPDLTPALAGTFPDLTLRWTEEHTSTLVQQIHEGALDGAILALEADIDQCEYARLGWDPFVLAASPAHPLMKNRKPATLPELNGASLLLLDDGHCFRNQALSLCTETGAKEMNFRATSLPTLVQMVSAGTGATLLPTLALPVENRRSQLRIRTFVPPGPGRTLALAWRHGSSLRPALSRVADTMRTALGRSRLTKPRRSASG